MIKPLVCALVGPTASGKSAAALAVARALSMEIVSADSMQVYRGMDIGTAKSTQAERALVRHHMIDVADPGQKYTAARFRQEGALAIAEILARGNVPLVVGGTGLYVSALLDGLDFAQAQGGGEERERWEKYLAQNGASALHGQLRERDPKSAEKLHENDTRRVIRALEVYDITGRPIGERASFAQSFYDVRMAGLSLNREQLNLRIDERVDAMMRAGLEAEARALLQKDLQTAAQALGYKELFEVFRGDASLDEAIRHIKTRTRQYAKRQMTWFKRDVRIRWFDALDPHVEAKLMEYFAET